MLDLEGFTKLGANVHMHILQRNNRLRRQQSN